MKMIIPCSECSKGGIVNMDFIEVEITNEGVYEATCVKGHTSLTFTQEPLFELLFDMGGLALLDGYNREAVTNFAAALERFYEFCIEVMTYSLEIGDEVFEQTWKLVNRSERQIGAFYLLYLNEFKKTPNSIEKLNIGKKNIANFRNDVVHNGYIPSQQNAVEYGEKIYDYIISTYKELRERCPYGITKAITNKQTKYYRRNEVEDVERISVMSSPTMLGTSRVLSSDNPTFNESLEYLRQNIYFRFKK